MGERMKAARRLLVIVLALLTEAAPLQAFEEIFQSPEDYLKEVFDGEVPEPASFWLVGERREAASRILGHEPKFLRTRYWKKGARSAWLLEEVGKSEPISAGFVVEEGRLVRTDILIYRESRGGEVQREFFTRQFEGAGLEGDLRLDRDIDAIVGATLSVNAVERLARLALWMERELDE